MEETLKISLDNLKERDRALLMKYCLDRSIHNSNKEWIMIPIFIALGSFIISVCGVVWTTQNKPLMTVVAILSFFGIVFFYKIFNLIQARTKIKEKHYYTEFKKLFRLHFGYSFKKNEDIIEFKI